MERYFYESDSHLDFSEGVRVLPIQSEQCGIEALPHVHSQVELIYITSGSYDIAVNDRNFTANEGDLVLFPQYSIHSTFAVSRNGGKYYYFHIHSRLISEMAGKSKAPFFQYFFSLTSPEQKLLWKADELSKEFTNPISELISDCGKNDYLTQISHKLNICKLLLAILKDSKVHKSKKYRELQNENSSLSSMQKATEYINANYATNIKGEDVAKMLGLSYKYFLQCFSKATGEGFSKYLNKTRIKYAKVLLSNTTLSVHNIASAVGYNSDSYFIVEFKKDTGITPLQFIKKYREIKAEK